MNVDVIKGIRRNLVLLSMLELIGGLFMIIRNRESFEMLIVILGIIAAAYGIITFFTWLVKRDKSNAASVIITAVLGVVAGAMLIFFADKIRPVFALISGAFAGIYGVVKLPNMFVVKKAGFKKWAIILIPIALTVGVGIFVGLNALKSEFSSQTASILLGAALIFGCAADIITIAGASNAEKEMLASKEIEVSDDEK